MCSSALTRELSNVKRAVHEANTWFDEQGGHRSVERLVTAPQFNREKPNHNWFDPLGPVGPRCASGIRKIGRGDGEKRLCSKVPAILSNTG